MRELSFAEVRAAGLRAYVEFAYVSYEYRPLVRRGRHSHPARL